MWKYAGVLLVLLTASCGGGTEMCPEYPDIFPDYVGVTVPYGTAPLRFRMSDGNRASVSIRSVADTLWYEVSSRRVKYRPFPVYLSGDAIDPYIVYRLIEPGYESWHDIEIRQREISSFRERTVVSNSVNAKGCINCHHFAGGDPSRMIFHARGAGGGTVFLDGEKASLLPISATYPAWHPGGRYVAFSSNTTRQCFTIDSSQPVEVYDTESDIVLLDLETGSLTPVPALTGPDILETFPAWSEDGGTLYYCAADNVEDIADNRGEVHYRLMSISFDGKGIFSEEPCTVWQDDSSSVSFPRVKGDRIMFTKSSYGTFPIWHREADLWILDTSTGTAAPAEGLNSDDTESYHSWSSNGRWIVFSSRRLDGRYTRLYISHCNPDGTFTKPFLLPQRKAEHNTLRLKSYNIPEFVTSPVPDRRKSISKLFDR